MSRWPAGTLRSFGVVPLERQEQALYFQWADYVWIGNEPLRPHVYHVPNGGSRRPGERGALAGQGVSPGVPDINVDVPAGAFHGLRIEMKRIGEPPTEAQIEMIQHRRAMGYRALIAEGFDAARRETVKYLALGFVVTDRWAVR